MDLTNFDFNQLIPDELTAKAIHPVAYDSLCIVGNYSAVRKWYDERFKQLGIIDYTIQMEILCLMEKAGILPYPIGIFNKIREIKSEKELNDVYGKPV